MVENTEYFSIGRVERDTGIARDTLRVWERRYGFPNPQRNAQGERAYTQQQVQKLHRVKRLLDQGMRPSGLLGLEAHELDVFEHGLHSQPQQPLRYADKIQDMMEAVKQHDIQQLQLALKASALELGHAVLVLEVLVPLLKQVGEEWAGGQLQIHHEHLLSQQLIQFLYSELSNFPLSDDSDIILATLPGEEHGLGLLLLMTLFAARGQRAINLGVSVPMPQLVDAAHHHKVRAVGITFSAAYQYKKIRSHVQELRASLDPSIELWIGGEGVAPLRKLPPGVYKFNTLEQLPELNQQKQ